MARASFTRPLGSALDVGVVPRTHTVCPTPFPSGTPVASITERTATKTQSAASCRP